MTDQEQPIAHELEVTPGAPGSSWLDEVLTLCLVAPLLLAFVPGIQDVVSRGFGILGADLPGWYLGALGVAFSAAYGPKASQALTGMASSLRPGPKP